MKWDCYYHVLPKQQLLELCGKWGPDVKDALCGSHIYQNEEGDPRMWSHSDWECQVKVFALLFLIDLLPPSVRWQDILNANRLNVSLFDKWWTLRRLGSSVVDVQTEEITGRLFESLDPTGNLLVDSWLSQMKNRLR